LGSLAALLCCVGDSGNNVNVTVNGGDGAPSAADGAVDSSTTSGDAGTDAQTSGDLDSGSAAKDSGADGALPLPSDAGPPVATNLALWLRADKGVTLNGANTLTWADQSGNGRDVTMSTAVNQPKAPAADPDFGNQLAIAFPCADQKASGASTLLANGGFAAAIAGPQTFYVVFKAPPTAAGPVLFEGVSGADYQQVRLDTGAGGWYASFSTQLAGQGTKGFSTSLLPDGTKGLAHLLIVVSAPTTALYVDHYLTANNTSTDTPVVSQVGITLAAGGAKNAGLNGEIAELIVFSSAHDNAARTQMAGYFNARYGLGVQP
jgi:hypothetical protein